MKTAAVKIGGIQVKGVDVDPQTRCAHYRSELDIIAIRFPCCGVYYPCYRCHQELAGHPAVVRPRDQFDQPAILCGACGREMSVSQYLTSGHHCPFCGAQFNPGCANHHSLYFHTDNEADRKRPSAVTPRE